MPVALFNRLAGRPAGRASSRTSAARVGVLLVLAPAVELAAAHSRFAGMGRSVDRQITVVGVLAGDLLQILPGVAKGSHERAVWHILLAASSNWFAFDL